MISIIYYAHNLLIYDTEREENELARLKKQFPTALIYNPNRENIQKSKNPMQACIHIIKDLSITGLAFSHDARKVALGVYQEIQIAKERHIPIYIINETDIHLYFGQMNFTKNDKKTDWARV